jgi:FecR protein
MRHQAAAVLSVFLLLASAAPTTWGYAEERVAEKGLGQQPFGAPPSGSEAIGAEPIGLFTAVEGNVFAGRTGALHPVRAALHEGIAVLDVIETSLSSRTKILLQDDTLLTVGEDSRIEIVEHFYQPEVDYRRTVMRLIRGQMRVLLGRSFSGAGSVVEVHTPTAGITASDASFLARVDDPHSQVAREGAATTGVMNIGVAGSVSFVAAGQQVTLQPGQRSLASPRGTPTSPVLVRTGPDLGLNKALRETRLRDQVKVEPARQTVVASGGADRVLSLAPKSVPIGKAQPTLQPVTPPAVISGAAKQNNSAPAAVVKPSPAPAPKPTPTVTPKPAAPPPKPAAPPPPPPKPSPTIKLPEIKLPEIKLPKINLRD